VMQARTGNDLETRSVPLVQNGGSNTDLASSDVGGILDTLDLPIIVVDKDRKVARFNAAATSALGLTVSDLGRLPSDIQPLRDLRDIDHLCAEVIAQGMPWQSEIQNADRCFLVRVAPYTGPNRQTEGAVLSFTNVTAFRASLAQAIYEREYTKTILNTVSEPLVVLDVELRVQTANRAFYAMFGVSRETAQGIALCKLGSQDWNMPGLWASLKANLSESRAFNTIEVEADFPAIGRRTVLLDARRLSRDRNAMILIALRDITEHKQQEEKLERTVAERTASLREIVGELEGFSYSIAHDMRAPLRGMQGFAKILLEEHAGQLDTAALDYLRRITTSARRLDRLTQDVLNYSKIVKAQIALESLDLDRLTRDIIGSYPDWQPPGVEIQIEGVLPRLWETSPS
jgi:two-component system, chemotaxis family, CheB/CheR fusion protein